MARLHCIGFYKEAQGYDVPDDEALSGLQTTTNRSLPILDIALAVSIFGRDGRAGVKRDARYLKNLMPNVNLRERGKGFRLSSSL